MGLPMSGQQWTVCSLPSASFINVSILTCFISTLCFCCDCCIVSPTCNTYALFNSPNVGVLTLHRVLTPFSFVLFSSRLLRPWLHLLLPGRQAAVLHRSGPRAELASLCHGAASLQRYDDCAVPDLRLQAPLGRSARYYTGHRNLHQSELLSTVFSALSLCKSLRSFAAWKKGSITCGSGHFPNYQTHHLVGKQGMMLISAALPLYSHFYLQHRGWLIKEKNVTLGSMLFAQQNVNHSNASI